MYYGQFETDKIIKKYFEEKIQAGLRGRCIEIGAYDGIKGSNTKYFANLGWDCICVEPNPFVFNDLLENRPTCHNMNVACGKYTSVETLKVVTMKSGIQSSLTALKLDNRLVEDYGHDIQSQETVQVPVVSLHNIILCSGWFKKPIDFISIDTEGTEYDILNALMGFVGINYCWEMLPKLFVVENNYEDKEIRDVLFPYYELVERYKVNDFFLRIT